MFKDQAYLMDARLSWNVVTRDDPGLQVPYLQQIADWDEVRALTGPTPFEGCVPGLGEQDALWTRSPLCHQGISRTHSGWLPGVVPLHLPGGPSYCCGHGA